MYYQHTEGDLRFLVHLAASWLTQGILQKQNEVWILPAEVEVQQAWIGKIKHIVRRFPQGENDQPF